MKKFSATTERARELRQNQSKAEQLFWARVRNRRLGGWKFKRQVPLGRYIADFYVDAVRAVIEVDGGQHSEEEHAKRDAERDHWFEKNGYAVIRIWNMHIYDDFEATLDFVLERLNELRLETS